VLLQTIIYRLVTTLNFFDIPGHDVHGVLLFMPGMKKQSAGKIFQTHLASYPAQ
jgi:hypothetical protein